MLLTESGPQPMNSSPSRLMLRWPLAAVLLASTLPCAALRTSRPTMGFGRRSPKTTVAERVDAKRALRERRAERFDAKRTLRGHDVMKQAVMSTTREEHREQWHAAAQAPPTRREVFGDVNHKLYNALKSAQAMEKPLSKKVRWPSPNTISQPGTLMHADALTHG